MKQGNWRSFEESRQFVRSLKLKNVKEWREYVRSKRKPTDIPSGLNEFYKKEWNGWGDFLGTGNIAKNRINFVSYEEARKHVHSKQFTGISQWYDYIKSGNKPKNIPSCPNKIYKKEWKGYADWFGKYYLPFDKARNYVRKLGLKRYTDWTEFQKSSKRIKTIPTDPSKYYKKEWNGWGDFLGTGNIAPRDIQFLQYKKAKRKIWKLNLSSGKEYRRLAKEGNLPKGLPRDPAKSYSRDWEGWGDFLGTGRIANQDKKFLSYNEAKTQVRKLSVLTLRNWQKAVSDGFIPENIPKNPARTYKKEWKSWGDFLMTENKNPRDIDYLPWDEAKKIYQKIAKENNIRSTLDWKNWLMENKLPQEIPKHPEIVYRKENILNRNKKLHVNQDLIL